VCVCVGVIVCVCGLFEGSLLIGLFILIHSHTHAHIHTHTHTHRGFNVLASVFVAMGMAFILGKST
jgi:hypothetical protein